MIGNFWRATGLDIKTKKIIYHSLVESHLNYSNIIWCSDLAKNLLLDGNTDRIPAALKPLITAQNKIIRAIFRKPKYDKKSKLHTEMTPLYAQLEVLKIQDLYYYNLGILIYDSFSNANYPDVLKYTLSSYIPKTNSDTISTRSCGRNLNYAVPKNYSSYRKPTTAGAVFWNSLPNELKLCPTKPAFKNKLKAFLLAKYAG